MLNAGLVCEGFRLIGNPGYFVFELLPKYGGAYTLNPARIELMYFPTFFGRNLLKKVAIQ